MLKKYVSWLTVAVVSAAMTAAFSSCNDDDEEPAVAPKVTIEKGKATASTLSFTLTPTDAKEVAYVVIKKTETVPDAATIIKTGQKAEAAEAKEYTASGLEAETAYVIAAAAMNGSVYSAVAMEEMLTNNTPPDPVDKPTVEIVPGEPTENTLTFSLKTSEGVDMAAYVCLKKGEGTVPTTPAEIYEGNGVVIDDLKAAVTVEGLDPETTYVIAVVVSAGEEDSDVKTAEMTTLKPEEQYDEVFETDHYIAAYFGKDIEEHTGPNGIFVLGLDNIPWTPDGYAEGAGIKHQFAFYSDLASDPNNAVPAEGTYTFDLMNGGEKGTIPDCDYSWWMTTTDEGYRDQSGRYLEATLTLTKSGSNWDVVMTGKTAERGTFKVTYSGPIKFENNTKPEVTDKNLPATYAASVYYSTSEYNPDSDNWVLNLYDKQDSPQMLLTIDFYSAVGADPLNPVIPTGTFSANDGGTYTAGTFTPGMNVLGLFDAGTYLQAIENGQKSVYYCTGGTFTITKSGTNYTVTCNFTTDKNTKVTASYTGTIGITNEYEPPMGDLTVTADRVFGGTGYYYGGVDVYDYYFRLADCELSNTNPPELVGNGPGNFVGFDLWSATPANDMSNIVIPSGTYTLSENQEAGTFDPEYTFCWHWNETGNRSTVKLASGTVTVSRTGTNYTVKLDGVSEDGNKFVCNYSGPIPMADGNAAPAPNGFRSGKVLYSQVASFDSPAYRRMLEKKSRSFTSIAVPTGPMRVQASALTR